MSGKEYTPVEAMDFLERKGLVPTESWDDLKNGEHSHAFTVAHSTGFDVLEDIANATRSAMEQGQNFADFKKGLKQTLVDKGWYGGRPEKVGDAGYLNWRLGVIYDTNLATAYAAGRYRQMTRVSDMRPIWVYSAVMDSHTRPAHRALNGKAYRADNPCWNTMYPPNGWKCRCTVYSLSESGAKSRGIAVDDSPPSSFLDGIPDEWRHNPGKEAFAPDFSKYKGLQQAKADDGRSVLKHITEAYRKVMEQTRLSKGEFETLARRVAEPGFGHSGIQTQVGTAPAGTEQYFDPKLMASDTQLLHAQRDAKVKPVPTNELSKVYEAINQPVAIHPDEAGGQGYAFIGEFDDEMLVKVFFDKRGKGNTLQMITFGLVDKKKYLADLSGKHNPIYQK